MSAADILLERETANDETALIVAVFVSSGTAVKRDELLFETENSKATQELRAPHAGILTHNLEVGQTVEFGVPIAQIVPAEEFAIIGDSPSAAIAGAGQNGAHAANGAQAANHKPASAPNGIVAVPLHTQPGRGRRLAEPRFSKAAAAMLVEYGLSSAQFDMDFVTTKEVESLMGRHVTEPEPAKSPMPRLVKSARDVAPPERPRLNGQPGQAIGGRKRAEIDALSSGAGDTMLSVLGVTIGSLPFKREPGDFLHERITDLVLFESARLLKKYPRLNSYFADGEVFTRDAVHAGLAMDSGGNLVVYGIENADQVSLSALPEIIGDAVARYVNNELTSAEMSRATFTVTDLSAGDLDFVFPLLPRGQTLILGITHSTPDGFRIFAGFDHRVTEGREVGIFLGELRERLQSFASQQRALARPASHCAYCDRSADEAVLKGKEKGLLKIVDRQGTEILCCASCWNGW